MSAAPARASRSDRRIALINPAVDAEDKAALAVKLLDSVLWVFKGTTQSNWIVCDAEAAQVVVVHHDEPAQRIAAWRNQGKLIVAINTDKAASKISPYTLIYPFPAVHVLRVLEQLDAELDFGSTGGRVNASAPSGNTSNGRGDSHGGDAWAFVDALRTLRLVNSADTWFVGKASSGPVLWVRGDGTRYCCEPATMRAIRTGTGNLSGLTLHKSAPPPADLTQRAGSELAWFAGYQASTVIAPWLGDRETYRLTRWPDFGRVQADDPQLRSAQIRVIAALDAGPATAVQLSTRTDTPLEVVVHTLNALASCEIVEVARTALPYTASTKPASPLSANRLRQFLRNMRKHLGLGSSA